MRLKQKATFGWQIHLVRNNRNRNNKVSVVLYHTLAFPTLSVCSFFESLHTWLNHWLLLRTLLENDPSLPTVNWLPHFIWSLDPKSTVTFQLCMTVYFFYLFFFFKRKKKRFDLFITRALAANGGLLEEVVVVWSGGSDTGVSFITVGHSL